MRTVRGLAAIALALVLCAPAGARAASSADLTKYVDPMIGTFGDGFVFPGPAAPFGMVQLSPDTDGYFAYTGYLYSDAFIRGFSHVHVESMGVHAAGDVPFMPTVGPIVSTDPAVFRSRFDHVNEHAEPGYYRVLLSTYGIEAELTAGTRVGVQRYTFPPSPQANVILDVGHTVSGTDLGADGVAVPGAKPATLSIDPPTGTVTGSVQDDGYTVFFAAQFDRPIASYATWNASGGSPQNGVASASGVGAGGAVTFDTTTDRTVVVRTGISFVSAANALDNLRGEMPGDHNFDFDAVRNRTRAAWNEALHTIEVDGGTLLDKRSFYTALYHAQHHPNVFEDANGQYLDNDGRVHTAVGFTYYTNFSLWDTYRTENQLLALIQPARFKDMMHSLLTIAEDSGRLPRWQLMNTYADFMNGEPAIPAIVDGYCRGLLAPDDVAGLYAAMRSLAFDQPREPSYLQYGYVPYDIDSTGASSTLEFAIDDFALALMADRLGETADRDRLLGMAGNWRNIFDAKETRLVRPRNSHGKWMTPYRPSFPKGFREGTGWQYTWLVPQDVAGLRAAMHPDTFTKRLDMFLSAPVATEVPYVVPEAQKHASAYGFVYFGNQYTPENETDLEAPYLYDYTGQPWKTQAIVRGLQGQYRPTPDGIPGNDDLGTMSAWYIWSALGLYPETAGAPLYVIGSPVFASASIHVPGGVFTIRAPGASAIGKYVQSARLDGASLRRTWFTHASLAPGGSLTLTMGPFANVSWGSRPVDAPPSQSTSPLGSFACAG
jgi:predicted alpha-1,2-mannosidase